MNNSINNNRINQNLKTYPKLSDIFGQLPKIKQIKAYPYRQDTNLWEYNFYGILNSTDPMFKDTLGNLNLLCKNLDHLYSDEQLKQGIRNNVFSFLSELKFANHCLTNGIEILEIEPQLSSGKKLDFKIKVEDTATLIEVITPRGKLEYIQKAYKWHDLSHKLETNMHAEFVHHNIEINDIKEPFIIVIDGDYAGIDEINLQLAIKEFIKNNKTMAKYLTGAILNRGETYGPIRTTNEIMKNN
ncbi:MAG: hypothetical protein KAH86_00580 [Methanosarcinales archaeon]|nr:hypothetical protein [Methanosarcinales archaeon]